MAYNIGVANFRCTWFLIWHGVTSPCIDRNTRFFLFLYYYYLHSWLQTLPWTTQIRCPINKNDHIKSTYLKVDFTVRKLVHYNHPLQLGHLRFKARKHINESFGLSTKGFWLQFLGNCQSTTSGCQPIWFVYEISLHESQRQSRSGWL